MRTGHALVRGGALIAACALAAPLTLAATTPAAATAMRHHDVASRAPSVRSMSLSVVNQGEVTYATIEGAGFADGLKVSLGPRVRCRVLSVTSTRIAVRLDVATNAAYGERTLSVTNPDRTSGTLHAALRVDYEAILERWAIGQGAVAFATSLVRPTFATPPTVSVSGGGVTVDGTSIGPGDVLDLTFTVEQHATPTWRTMTLTEGLSTWQVENGVRIRQAPTVTSVTPLGQDTVDQGVKVLGSNFEVCNSVEPTLSVSGAGVTVDSVSAALGTVMYAKLTVAPTAPIGPRDVTVKNCDSAGTATSANAFSVLAPPVVTSVASLAVGVSRTEQLAGTNLTPTTSFSVPGGGVTIDKAVYVSPERMRATITVSPTASVGPHDVVAADGAGTPSDATGVFTVDPLPTETSATPGGIGAGTMVTVTVSGTGFRRKAVVQLGEPHLVDPSLSVSATTWVSPTELQVKVTAPLATVLRNDTVTVENLDGGTTATLAFQTDPGPGLSLSSSSTRSGGVVATYTAPNGAPAGEAYDLRVCSNATLTEGCRTDAGLPSGATVSGLAPGGSYWGQLTAVTGTGFYAAVSAVVGPRRATSRLFAPVLRTVGPSARLAGAVEVTFAVPPHATAPLGYAATACRNAAMTSGCVSTHHVTSGGLVTGLAQGASYHVVVVALGSPGYLAASSKESRSVHATIQLGRPAISRATLFHGVLTVRFTGAARAPASERYTLLACTNAAMTRGCTVRLHYRAGEGVAGLGPAPRYARIVAAASHGYLAAASGVVRA